MNAYKESIKDKESVFIFDFDGTIADTFQVAIDIINKDPQRFGVDGIDVDEIPRLRSMSVPYLLREFNIHLFQLLKLLALMKKEISKEMENIKPFPEILKVIDTLVSEGNLVGILTSNSVENVTKFLKANSADDLFAFINSEKHIFGKNKTLEKIIKKKTLDKDKVYYIGDEVRDIEAAQKVGVRCISVVWGFNSEEILRKHAPDYLISDPTEILDIAHSR